VAARAAQELNQVQLLVAGEGWTDGAVARALAALRVIASLAIGWPVSEKALANGAEAPEGRLLVSHGRIKPRRAAVSSSVTAADVAAARVSPAGASSLTRQPQVEGLASALGVLTAALYQQVPTRDAAALDEATRHGLSVARDLARERNWWSRLRQGYGGRVGAKGTSWSRR
jgi:hypothetical protein